ncbi:MAG TPA: CHAT domain-containing protein [Candidatus Angelobacter sp.]|nr:CHAT domain-containing protein [Candidatus Angelobacter sp.]
MALLAVIAVTPPAVSQNILSNGVIIEEVTKDYEASRAGLQPGDVVQAWARGADRREIKSAFDLSWVETEQAPRGEVTLRGLRRGAEQVWKLGGGRWQVTARPDLPDSLLVVYRDGQKLMKDGKLSDAAARWREGAAKADELQLKAAGLWLRERAANGLTAVRQWNDADQFYQQAIQQSADAGSYVEAQLWNEWAVAYAKRADWEDAEKCARVGLTQSQAEGANSLQTAGILNILGSIAFYRRQINQSEEYYNSAFSIIRDNAPQGIGAGVVLDNLGNIASTRGDLNKAEELYQQGLAILRKFPPEGMEVSWLLLSLSKIFSERGDLAKAEESLQSVVAIQQRLVPHSLTLATGLNDVGVIAWQRGNLREAEYYFQQGLALRRELAPGSLYVAESLTNLGATELERGEIGPSESYHQEALALKQKLAPDSLDLSDVLNNLGILAQKRSDLAKAEDFHLRAIEIRRRLAPESLSFAESLQNLGEVAQSRGDLGKAEDYFRQSLAIRERIAPNSSMRAESLASLASAIKSKGDLGTAGQLFEKALSVLEAQIALLGGGQETHVGFRAQHIHYYLDYVDLLMLNHKPELAFQVLERSRARSLVEMLSEAHTNIHTGVNPNLLEQERSLRARITSRSDRRMKMMPRETPADQVAAVESELAELLGQYQKVEGAIRSSSPSYASLIQPQPLTASQVQETLLDEDTLLLEYALGEERSYVWAISRTQVASSELSKRSEIEEAARRVYESLTARSRSVRGETHPQREARLAGSDAAYARAVKELGRLIVAPVFAQILHKKRLLVVCDGILQYIPFALLPVDPTSNGKLADSPLVAEHEIINLPSASILAELRRDIATRPKYSKRVAVLADPVFSREDARTRALATRLRQKESTLVTAPRRREDLTRAATDLDLSLVGAVPLARLPFTQQEALAIMATVEPGQGMAALGFDADRAKATSPELANYRVVHFATHGLLDNQHPELSGLVFSLFDRKGEQQNGFLKLEDIYNLNLPADLVVLSACETGLGKYFQGEGLVGLTRGFMYAGAKRVVASLWRVNDVATSELMGRFYNAMFHEGLSPSAALRKAQLQMLQQERWQSPYYWAAFVLQGDWTNPAQ